MGWDYWEKTGKYYKMFKKELSWMEAQFNCTSLGVSNEKKWVDPLIGLFIIKGKSCYDP